MAQLRRDYDAFVARGAEIVAVAPDDPDALRQYWSKEQIPFVGLADPEHKVSKLYGQQVKLLRLGRMPALTIIDQSGHVRLAHYGESMRDIPDNRDVLEFLSAM
jgi:peroxiredoxin Q/BCP